MQSRQEARQNGVCACSLAFAVSRLASFSFLTSSGVSLGRSIESVTFLSLPVNLNSGL